MKTPEQELDEIGGEPLAGSGFEREVSAGKADALLNGEPISLSAAAGFVAEMHSKGNLRVLKNEVSLAIASEVQPPEKP